MIKNEITELEAKKKELNYEEPLDIKIELIDSFNNTSVREYLNIAIYFNSFSNAFALSIVFETNLPL